MTARTKDRCLSLRQHCPLWVLRALGRLSERTSQILATINVGSTLRGANEEDLEASWGSKGLFGLDLEELSPNEQTASAIKWSE